MFASANVVLCRSCCCCYYVIATCFVFKSNTVVLLQLKIMLCCVFRVKTWKIMLWKWYFYISFWFTFRILAVMWFASDYRKCIVVPSFMLLSSVLESRCWIEWVRHNDRLQQRDILRDLFLVKSCILKWLFIFYFRCGENQL